MLGQWEEAASDLHVASKLDYDEEIGSVLKKVNCLCLLGGVLYQLFSSSFVIIHLNPQVEPNAHKIEEHRRKYERLRKERALMKVERERQQRTEAQVSSISVII